MFPYGETTGIANPDLDEQSFLGLKVLSCSCTSSWDAQGGECEVALLSPPGYSLQNVAVGSPQYFEIIDKQNNPVFRFYGVLDSLKRDVSSQYRTYIAKLQSPTILLDAVNVITNTYTGYGGAIEAVHPNRPTCLDFGHNNLNSNPTNTYNVINALGAYENDAYGFNQAGFGRAGVNSQGMQVNMFAYAVNQILNGDTTITPELGGNIIYGVDSYDNPQHKYAYNFNIVDFVNSLSAYIPNDYRVQSSTLMDFVSEICNQANHVFYVDLKKPAGSGNSAFSGADHEAQNTPSLVYNNTIYGGEIVVITQNRNEYDGDKFPLSKLIIQREISENVGGDGPDGTLPLDIGLTGNYHPDGPPVTPPPIGGSFPLTELPPVTRNSQINSSLSVAVNKGAAFSKYVVGGYQSRMNYIRNIEQYLHPAAEITGSTCTSQPPGNFDTSDNILCYWGTIKRYNAAGQVDHELPVITSYLDVHPFVQFIDVIAVDVQHVFGNSTLADGWGNYAVINGIYFCSNLEMRFAMTSYEAWNGFVEFNKPLKMDALRTGFSNRSLSHPKYKNSYFLPNGNLSPLGRLAKNRHKNASSFYNTIANEAGLKDSSIAAVNNFPTHIVNSEAAKVMIWQTLKALGDEHYGKSFVAKMPAFTVKKDEDHGALLNDYVKSWDISDSAYLDPVNYSAYDAPIASNFVSGGRLSAYVNFTANANEDDIQAGKYGLANLFAQTNPFMDSINNYHDFSEYQPNELVSNVGNDGKKIVSVHPDIELNYKYVPAGYFGSYDIVNYASLFSSWGNSPSDTTRKNIAGIPSDSVSAAQYLRSVSSQINDSGLGMQPFVLFKVKPVYLKQSSGTLFIQPSINDMSNLSIISGTTVGSLDSDKLNLVKETVHNSASSYAAPAAAIPRSAGIPQQSNRYVYGPWTTANISDYVGKVEYIQDESLVPENYIIPVGSVDFNGGTSFVSGYQGLNLAGNLIANTIDAFNYFFIEEGSIEVTALPEITSLGQSLVENGPLVSDISISMNEGVRTTYSMSTYATKFGRNNQFILDRIRRIADKAKL